MTIIYELSALQIAIGFWLAVGLGFFIGAVFCGASDDTEAADQQADIELARRAYARMLRPRR